MILLAIWNAGILKLWSGSSVLFDQIVSRALIWWHEISHTLFLPSLGLTNLRLMLTEHRMRLMECAELQQCGFSTTSECFSC